MLGAVIPRVVTLVHAENTAADSRKGTLQIAERGVFGRPLHDARMAARWLDAVGVDELHRGRAKHLQRSRQQPAVGTVRNLSAPLCFHGLTVAAPERAQRSPYSRLE